MHGWRSVLASSIVAVALLLVPAGEAATPAARAAGGCSLSLSGTPQVGQAISIAGAGYPANASVDIVFTVGAQEADAFAVASDAAGTFRIDLTLETVDLGPTTVKASVAGTACTAQVSYTVVSAPGGPTPGPTLSPSPTPTVNPSGTPRGSAKPSSSPRPSVTPKPTARPKPTPTPRPRATPRPSPTHRTTATPRPGHTPRPSRHPSATASGAAAGAGGTTPPPTDGSTGGAGEATPVTILALAAVAFLALALGGWLADRRRAGQAAPPR